MILDCEHDEILRANFRNAALQVSVNMKFQTLSLSLT